MMPFEYPCNYSGAEVVEQLSKLAEPYRGIEPRKAIYKIAVIPFN